MTDYLHCSLSNSSDQSQRREQGGKEGEAVGISLLEWKVCCTSGKAELTAF